MVAKADILLSEENEAVYAIIRNDESGELASHCRRKMKYRCKTSQKPETKATDIRNRAGIHEHPAEADGKLFGD